MRKPILAALGAFLLGTTTLSGCFFVPPFWWEPYHGHDGRWERRDYERHDRRERRGDLAPRDEQRRAVDDARPGHDDGAAG